MAVNAATVSAGEALTILAEGWRAQSAGGLTASWMLHGRPGVGKTQVVQELADQIGARLFDLRLTTIEPQDLRGLPYYDHETRRTVWYRPEDLPDDPGTPSVLFLDELTSASPYLQPTVYGLLQERRVGRHLLPDSVFIVAAGNTVEDGAIAYEMGTALSDRLIHMLVRADADDWLDRLRSAARPASGGDRLHPHAARPSRDDRGGAAARADHRLHAALVGAGQRDRASVPDRRSRNAMVAGTVGEAAAADFAIVADDVAATVRVDELLNAAPRDRPALYPDTLHGLNALVYALVGAADARRIDAAIEVMDGIRHLPRHRDQSVFQGLPLAELTTFGFEMLIARALGKGLQDAFLRSGAYRAYADERRDAGLE